MEKIFFMIFVIKFSLSCANIQENFLMNHLVNFFDDNEIETKSEGLKSHDDDELETIKREALIADDPDEKEKFAQLLTALSDGDRANHYWTRKRGRDRTTNSWWNYYDINYNVRPTQFSYGVGRPAFNRGKRATELLKKLRLKRQTDENVEQNTEKIEEIATETSPKSETLTTMMEMEKKNENNSTKKNVENFVRFGGDFRRSMLKCCSHESDIVELNQTLIAIKNQCQKDIRKTMKNSSFNPFNGIDNEDTVLQVVTCQQSIRMKAMMFCTLDCVAQKLGMIDQKGIINLEAAKTFVIENFAREAWEKNISNEIVEKCVTKVNSSKRENVDAMGIQCNIRIAEFGYCIWKELFLVCPADKQISIRPCSRLRASLQS